MSSTTPRGAHGACTAHMAVRARGQRGKGRPAGGSPSASGGRPGGEGALRLRGARRLGARGPGPLLRPGPGPPRRSEPPQPEGAGHSKPQAAVTSSCPRRTPSAAPTAPSRAPPVQRRRAAARQAGLPQRPSQPGTQGLPGLRRLPGADRQGKDPDGTGGHKGSPGSCAPASDSPGPPNARFPCCRTARGTSEAAVAAAAGFPRHGRDLAAERRAGLLAAHPGRSVGRG